MSITDPEASSPAEDDAETTSGEPVAFPSIRQFRWPIVRALRKLGGQAPTVEIAEHVADAFGLTRQQRSETVPSGQVRLVNRVQWASLELKHIEVLHYPEPGIRALTPLGLEVDEERIRELHAQYEAEERERKRGALPGTDSGHESETDSGGDEPDEASDLSALVEQFRAETDYPTAAHEGQERLREEWAKKLSPETIESLSREDLTAFTNNAVNNGEYVRRVGGVMQWISDLGEPEFDNLLDNIKYLCWGEDEDELSVRFDQLYVGDSPRKVKGYAGVNISRTLAICHPKSFLPVHRNVGNWGRAKMLSKLGLPAPLGNTPGQRVVDANDRLLEHLKSHFGDDTLAMGAFLEWMLQQQPQDSSADLTELAAELLIDDVDFLEDIVELLQDKGQVILYGPPGTGKTHLARELARELAPDDSCRALVQFHPSTSYEDFFEGYRPAGTGDDGNVRYELTPGPLARMAEQASKAPDKQHVMIIDEINRGNLPRVLGELLFLLEYRKERVQTLYRPEKPFELPENLWFIGTMNTADRSIALVDAALRRRFHFVPFFPDSGPMAGLLRRWLRHKNQPAWVGDLVDAVNEELKKELGGSHLLLGPSHFMKTYGSSLGEQRQQLRRIWEYNIEPFVEDQFFGDPEQIDRFRFNAVMRRHGPAAESDVDAGDDSDAPESTGGPDGEHAAADGEAAAEPGSTPESER